MKSSKFSAKIILIFPFFQNRNPFLHLQRFSSKHSGRRKKKKSMWPADDDEIEDER